ncbi:MAG: flavodoxin domain-containing protein [Anaerolineales bacterium]|nr:flavodoxin domain-containing protein [Anaerolineales bacterium]
MSNNQSLNRRQFLKIAGASTAATVLTCSGLSFAATRRPSIPAIHACYGETSAMRKTLVTYATRAGATGEVADLIGQVLASSGTWVDVLPVENVHNLGDYQSVIVGSAIRYGRWLPEAAEFIHGNLSTLATRPLAYFTVCMAVREDTPQNRARAEEFVQPVRALLEPRASAIFAGKVDHGRLTLAERLISGIIQMPQGDFRDWQAIRSWGETLPISA